MGDELSLGDRKAVQAILEQKKEESSFEGWVQKKAKNGTQKRLVVITANRLYSLKPGGKVAREGHWLDLLSIQSPSKNDVTFTFKNFKLTLNSDYVDDIINNIRTAYGAAFPGIPEKDRLKLEISPSSRMKDFTPSEQPLGGFINTYRSLCNFYGGAEVRGDFIWDMENLFIPGNVKEFSLNELEQPISANELKPLLGALQYNTWFKGLTAKDFNMDKAMIQSVADALKTNSSLDELDFNRSGINKDGLTTISEALATNKVLQLTTINISHNAIEDKGMSAFASYIGSMNKGVVKLDVSNCGASKIGTSALCSALKKNPHMASTLTYFDISQNKLEAEGSAALGSFLANTNGVRYLLLSNTVANTDVIIGAIQRGCNELHQLDLSNNKFTKTPNFPKYLQGSANLVNLNLSNTGAPVEVYKEILTAIMTNVYLKDCVLNLSKNNLGLVGARILAAIADKINNIHTLDLGDNDFGDDGVSIVADGFCHNTSTKNLSLASNFKGKGGRARQHAIESIITLINSECPLESLNLSAIKGTELKNEIIPLLYALGTNETLLSIDISGNQMGNKGAVALGKAVQTNEALLTLRWDGNATTLQGFQGFNNGLRRNHTVKNMPLPIEDISAILKGSEAQKVNEVVNQMEMNILRNQSPASRFQTNNENGNMTGGSQFGFLSSGQREGVQKTLFKIKTTSRKVSDEKKIIIEDAENQDSVMTGFYAITDQVHQEFDIELKKSLQAYVTTIAPLFGKMKGKLIAQIVEQTKRNFKSLEDDIVRRLQTNLAYGGKDLPEEEFERVIVNAAAAELSNKGNQGFLSTVSIASDYLYEKIQDKLQDILFELSEAANQAQAQAQAQAQGVSSPSKPLGGSTTNGPPQKPQPQPPTKVQPKIPPKVVNKKPVVPPKGNRGQKPETETEAHVEALPKVESNLNHATKDRAAVQQKRKPPTRKPRPAPPAGTAI